MKKILSLITMVFMLAICYSQPEIKVTKKQIYKIAELIIYKTPEGYRVMEANYRADQYQDLCAFLEDVRHEWMHKCQSGVKDKGKPEIGKPIKKPIKSTFLYLPKIPQPRE